VERQQQMDELMKAIVVHFHQDSGRLEAKAEMENRARAHRGKPRVPAESLVVQLALQDVIERVPTSRLTTADARTAPASRACTSRPRSNLAAGSTNRFIDGRSRSRWRRKDRAKWARPNVGAGLGGNHARRLIELVMRPCVHAAWAPKGPTLDALPLAFLALARP
jgi:hypothetical protein